ncbi:MAG TPA: OsmC family protein [Fimbriimonadales bacterium]|jgi:putative redox protein|nr:OsmC family protein [Fimbriimonadales bacterium]
MEAKLSWKGEYKFQAEIGSGASLAFDNADEGVSPIGPSPMEALLTSLAACTAMDVISILEKKRQKVHSYTVEIEGDRDPPGTWPRPFKEFRVKHRISGENIDGAAVARAIELSESKYCSVSQTLKTTPPIINEWIIE